MFYRLTVHNSAGRGSYVVFSVNVPSSFYAMPVSLRKSSFCFPCNYISLGYFFFVFTLCEIVK